MEWLTKTVKGIRSHHLTFVRKWEFFKEDLIKMAVKELMFLVQLEAGGFELLHKCFSKFLDKNFIIAKFCNISRWLFLVYFVLNT